MTRRNRADEARLAKREDGKLTVKEILAKAAALTGNQVDEASAIQAIEDRENLYDGQGAVVPDYDPEAMLNFVELSPHLKPNIDAYVQNIEGYGYQHGCIEPWMEDLEGEEAYKAVHDALVIEAWAESEENALASDSEKSELLSSLRSAKRRYEKTVGENKTAKTIKRWKKELDEAQGAYDDFQDSMPDGEEGIDEDSVSEEVVNAKLKEIEIQKRREEFMFDSFFKHCCSTMSFTKLRRIVRQDIESNGWGCMEMIRDGYGRLKRLSYIPGYTVRPLKNMGEQVEVIEPDPITPISEGREIAVNRRFPIFVQIVNGKKVYFKSPQDPRVVSRTTGKTYESLQKMRLPEDKDGEGKEAQPAHELIWIAQHSAKTACPPPRWVGNLLQVLGGREADETNYYYLRDNAIPYGLLFVSGGQIPTDIRNRLEHRLSAEVKGSEGSGKILVVQARPMAKASADGRTVLPEMEFKSLREAVQNDALFTKYDERGSDRIGASFRLSPILRGYTPSTLNRATALAAVMLAEQQVFQPEREDFDWIINKYVLPEIGIRYLNFVSNSPPTRSIDDVEKIIKAAAPQGGLLPYEIRELLGMLLNKPLAKVKEEWAYNPMVMTLAGISGDSAPTDIDENGEFVGQEDDTELGRRLAGIESKVQAIVAQELEASGIDMDVSAAYFRR